jgi:hypothetical protein
LTPHPPKNAWTLPRRLVTWTYAERWLLLIFFAALVVRLHWNLVVHPLEDYVYSDMRGYVSRAERLLRSGLDPHEYSSFFPFGNHWIIAGVQKIFGEENYRALAIVWALMGATTTALGYAVARRASGFAIVPPAVGLLGVFYYPHFSLGGYLLSELPFSLFLMTALLFTMRLVDRGRWSDAVMMGVFAGVGAWVRPQILLSAAAIGLLWIARRKGMPKVRLPHLVLGAGIPIVLCLAVSSILLHHNTGRRGLVSENGSFNLVFGRCHNSKIESLPDGEGHGKLHFRPPEFLQIKNHEKQQAKDRLPPEISLDPAIEDTLSYRGYIGDRKIHMDYVKECIRRTGWTKQLAYAWTNVQLLWLHNVPWPDSSRPTTWRLPARWWTYQHRVWLAIPALLGLCWIFVPGRRNAKRAVMAVNLLALLLLSAMIFGGTRHRVPYDFILIFLAFETYAVAGALLWRGVQRIRKRRQSGDSDSTSPEA